MPSMERWRTVALLGREAGLRTLRDGILRNPRLQLLGVASHRRLPRSQSPSREVRPEWSSFAETCTQAEVPLVAIDRAAEGRAPAILDELGPVDLLVSVSWRYVLGAAALRSLRVGGVNLHRGALPAYAGSDPVRRMLEDGRPDAEITAHLMVEEVDAGPVLATVRHPMDTRPGVSLEERVERTKAELVPLYPALLDLAVAALLARTSGGAA